MLQSHCILSQTAADCRKAKIHTKVCVCRSHGGLNGSKALQKPTFSSMTCCWFGCVVSVSLCVFVWQKFTVLSNSDIVMNTRHKHRPTVRASGPVARTHTRTNTHTHFQQISRCSIKMGKVPVYLVRELNTNKISLNNNFLSIKV